MVPQEKKLRFDEISNSPLGLFSVAPHLLSRHRFEGDKFAKETVVAQVPSSKFGTPQPAHQVRSPLGFPEPSTVGWTSLPSFCGAGQLAELRFMMPDLNKNLKKDLPLIVGEVLFDSNMTLLHL